MPDLARKALAELVGTAVLVCDCHR